MITLTKCLTEQTANLKALIVVKIFRTMVTAKTVMLNQTLNDCGAAIMLNLKFKVLDVCLNCCYISENQDCLAFY